MKEKKALRQYPDELTVYDYEWDHANLQYSSWDVRNENFSVNNKLKFNEVMIPTSDSTRNLYLLKMLIENNIHILTPGPTGTGKSANIALLLTYSLSETY